MKEMKCYRRKSKKRGDKGRRSRRMVWISNLLFLLLFLCAGCQNTEEKRETVGQAEKEEANCLVLYDGGEKAGEVAIRIGQRLKVEVYNMTVSKKEEIQAAVSKAEYLFLGTEQKSEDFYEKLNQCFPKQAFEQKKIALFLVDQGEKTEEWEKMIQNGYSEAVMLPSIAVQLQNYDKMEEYGRMDGWMTTALTYELIRKMQEK